MDRTTVTAEDLVSRSLEIRKQYFNDEITFHAPGLKSYSIPGFEQKNPKAFLPISITGSGCALNCDHCESKILEPMLPLNMKEGIFNMCKRLSEEGTESVLISGGSQKNGKVPFLKHIDEIKRIKDELGLKVIMHTGLVDDEMAKALHVAGVDGVALDIIGANETIKDVYHLNLTTEDYDNSMQLLASYGLSLRPHIILGLHYGKFLGEYNALDLIAKYPVHALVLVILTPMHSTAMQNVSPPSVEEVTEFMHQARLQMPDTKIMMGCARPSGDYKRQVDLAAIDAGINGIAYPADGVIDYAISKGLRPTYFENSCSCGVN